MHKTLIYESNASKIYTLEESKYGSKVIVKEQKVQSKSISKLVNQYELLKNLNLSGISKVIACEYTALEPYIIFEYAEGDSLRDHLRYGPFSLMYFLEIAIPVCRNLMALHRAGIIHKDINPNNIIWEPKSGKVTLIDFDCSTSIKQHNTAEDNAGQLDGTLAYIAPEQTNRINREVDFRSDLYSLGVTFYEMLCGEPPFQSADPNELLYAHIARMPQPLAERNNNIPPAISNLVMKLLQKNAVQRYQSAAGVLYDLLLLHQKLEKAEALSDITLGSHDFSDVLQLSQKLYGREEKVELLKQQFKEVSTGSTALVLVEGSSGTGKSALVNELSRGIIESKGIFLSGKFDQYKRNIPYVGWVQVFQKFVAYILSRDSDELATWKNTILTAVGTKAKVLEELVPNLEVVIGAQPPVEKLNGTEAQNRFNYILLDFIKAMCAGDSPVVIFLDDLQWADAASVQVLQSILGAKEIKKLLLITAFRSPAEDVSGLLKITVTELQALCTHQYIKLADLDKDDIIRFIEDSLIPCGTTANDLAAILFEKTRGNAFFIKKFIRSLYDMGLLYFNYTKECWCCKQEEVKDLQVTDNVVAFMTQRINELDADVIRVLKLAAVIGGEFSEELLQNVAGTTDITRLLQKPLSEGFITILLKEGTGPMYGFSHDRIYQAVSELNNKEETEEIHYKIASLLLTRIPEHLWYEQAFVLANHVNEASKFLKTEKEQDIAIRLNLSAGRRAKATNAYALSINYLTTGIAYVKKEISLHLSFLEELIESYYLNGQFEQSKACVNEAKKIATTKEDRLKIWLLEIRLLKAQTDFKGAIHTGIEALKMVGERIGEHPGKLAILVNFIKLKVLLRNKKPGVLYQMPEATNADKLLALQILSELGLAAYLSNQNLLPILTLKAVELSVKHGNSQYAPSDYNVYGFMLGQMGSLKEMKTFALLSDQLLQKIPVSTSMRAKQIITFNALTRHWFEHPSVTLPQLTKAYRLGRESGDLDAAFTSLILYWDHSFFLGADLKELSILAKDNLEICKQIKQKQGENFFTYVIAFLESLMHPEQPFHFSMKKNEALFIQLCDATSLCKLSILKALHSYFSGNSLRGLQELQQIKKHELSIGGLIYASWLPFLKVMLAGEVLKKDTHHREAKKALESAVRKLKNYAAFCGENFYHRKLFADAVLLSITHKEAEAAALFEQSAVQASEHKFPVDQSIAAWQAAKSYKGFGNIEKMNTLALSAYQLFSNWNFKLTADAIKEEFVQAVAASTRISQSSTFTVGTSSPVSGSINLDLTTVIKTLQALSSEIVFSNLVNHLLRNLAENAGAEKGFLILDKEASWLQLHQTGNGVLKLLSISELETKEDVPTQIALYCLRSGETVILESAHTSENFATNAYVLKNKPRSVLCIPLKKAGIITGLLYMENNLVEGAFKGERSELIRLISTQLAVSIENAFLYENLEQRVIERTNLLQIEKQKSDNLLLNILPEKVANELKEKGSSEATLYESVTVLFADFVSFTKVSEKLTPKELVNQLNYCFKAFDEITERHGIEKIKTIGDAYMAVCGLPVENKDHFIKAVQAAIEMQDFIQNDYNSGGCFQVRIGVHSGPVVAGIVGIRKFQYDIWGDTVNIAARLQQCSDPGKINISHETYQFIKEQFTCTYRGKINAKNKGEMDMYFVEG